jgi:uncharacterized protein (UPF0305 family)
MRNEKLSVTISKEFAEELRRYVPSRKRSQFIEQAALEKLRIIKQKKALDAAAGAWRDEDHPELVKAGVDEWLRQMRSSWVKRSASTKLVK